MIEELINSVNDYITAINYNNFSEKYDGLASIIMSYNQKGLGKITIITALNKYYSENGDQLNLYQDEVFTEIFKCIEGFTSIHLQVNLVSFYNSP